MTEHKKKLIEVGLPLEKINEQSAREKSIRHGHPSTLHLWWARRPLATARAVLFAQLVDDPSAHPEQFPTQEAQDAERKRLHELIEAMVDWDNIQPDKQGIPLPSLNKTVTSAELFSMAQDEIRKSNGGQLPAVLDPFAGGGTIPLEAQRLGLEAHASDLNPVAVLINKALIEIPPKFSGLPPVHPDAGQDRLGGWHRAEGLAEDVRYYGKWMRDQAEKRIGHLYPKVTLADGSQATVIAWIWARTVTCPNPACHIAMPLVRSWWLGKKKGKEAYVVPTVVDDPTAPSGRRVKFTIGHDKAAGPTAATDGTVGRQGARCVACETAVSLNYIRDEGKAHRITPQLMAIVAEGNRQRIYLAPADEHIQAAQVDRPSDIPGGSLPANPRDFKTPNYGMTEWADLFTNRQLVALTTFSDLVTEARTQVVADGGTDDYANAVATYLAFAISKYTDYSNSLCRWMSQPKNELVGSLFARQAIPMVWDFAESNPLGSSNGPYEVIKSVAKVLDLLPASSSGVVSQTDASSRDYSSVVVSTDPPYYDNIGYSDLSDFFYVWLRRSLHDVHPDLFSTVLVPKAEELVANPYRQGGRDQAEQFFVNGFNSVFGHVREGYNGDDKLLTVYYAYKQQDADAEGTSSTGWHTLLDGLVREGWEITATWPVRSERGGRMIGVGTNALASSIVLACRPRPEDAPASTRRAFLAMLKSELPGALRAMMQGAVAPVDLAQAAIGPGMSIFSRYSRIREPDGSDMSVRDALQLINATLDQVMDEQESDYDPDTRFAVKWYRTYGWGTESSGTADTLARATGTSPGALERGGIFEAKGGKAKLLSPKELGGEWNPDADERVSVWEAVVRLAAAMDTEGASKVAALLSTVGTKVSLDTVKELGFMLFHEAEKKGNSQDALLFNALVSSWSELTSQAKALASQSKSVQDTLDFGEDE